MNYFLSRIVRLAGAALSLVFASCTMVPELGALADRGDTRDRRIVVNLGEQKAYLYPPLHGICITFYDYAFYLAGFSTSPFHTAAFVGRSRISKF